MTPHHVDDARRQVLFGCASLIGLSMGGCSALPQRAKIDGRCDPLVAPFLAGPEVEAAWAKPERYFDAHTHFFNASDVPVEGFLAKSVAHSIESQELRELLVALAPLAQLLARTFAPTPAEEMKELCKGLGARTSSLLDVTLDLDKRIDDRRQQAAMALFEEIQRRNSVIPGLVNRAAERASFSASGQNNRARPFSRQFVIDAFRFGSSAPDLVGSTVRPLNLQLLSAQDLEFASIQNVFQFVSLMLSPRHHNLRTYIKRSAESSPGLPLSGCFAAMVDFNYWLPHWSQASNMRDQVMVHEQMALLSRGFMLPLVAYNPWVDIEQEGESLRTVEWAIKEHGCVGVKIYPPMGFYPFGNTDADHAGSREPFPDPNKLNDRLASLYALCDRLSVPVMAHANASNGRDDLHDRLAGVRGWKAVQDGLPELKSLYVNAGHFGGEHDYQHVDWTADFIALMKKASNMQVYGDLGFWESLLNDDEGVREKLRGMLRTPLNQNETVADRTMYGSDWHMLSRIPGWESYAEKVAEVIRDFEIDDIAPRVLGGNVLRCYGLDRGTARPRLQRLSDYYQERGYGPGPGWLRA